MLDSAFYVPPFLDFLGGLVDRGRAVCLALARLETALLTKRLIDVPVRQPIYVCGLARAGSTLLHEFLAAHAEVATHRVKDYPMLLTPYWWRQATANLQAGPQRERPHRDRLTINLDSPDSLEEMLWMAFFPRCHDPTTNNIIPATAAHPAFESFYDAHLRKLMLAEGKARYVAKANYHVARLAYLVRRFPGVRFVIPVRAPEGHVVSLLRQHRRFAEGQRRQPRALAMMRRTGHFEFGRDRRPLNLGDRERVRQIQEAWATGAEARGFALSWDMVYRHVHHTLLDDAQVRAAACIVPYEKLCAEPAATLRAVARHCQLTDDENIVRRFAAGISAPAYYEQRLNNEESAVVRDVTSATARQWGY